MSIFFDKFSHICILSDSIVLSRICQIIHIKVFLNSKNGNYTEKQSEKEKGREKIEAVNDIMQAYEQQKENVLDNIEAGSSLENVPSEFRNNIDVVIATVRNNPEELQLFRSCIMHKLGSEDEKAVQANG